MFIGTKNNSRIWGLATTKFEVDISNLKKNK